MSLPKARPVRKQEQEEPPKKPADRLKALNKEYILLSDIKSEPAYTDVEKTVLEYRESGADLIIAVGGGSVMDTAKVVSVLGKENYGVMELFNDQSIAKKGVRTLMIPTTAGTGAEATPIAIVTFPEKELKMRIVNDGMMADYCILDPFMIKNMPTGYTEGYSDGATTTVSGA